AGHAGVQEQVAVVGVGVGGGEDVFDVVLILGGAVLVQPTADGLDVLAAAGGEDDIGVFVVDGVVVERACERGAGMTIRKGPINRKAPTAARRLRVSGVGVDLVPVVRRLGGGVGVEFERHRGVEARRDAILEQFEPRGAAARGLWALQARGLFAVALWQREAVGGDFPSDLADATHGVGYPVESRSAILKRTSARARRPSARAVPGR